MREDILRLLELAKGWDSDMPNEKERSFSIIPLMYERISLKELLHSEIIAELLRPGGTHNCGDLFLQEFMRSIEIDPKLQDFSDIEVITESYTDTGRRIDILIVWGNNAVIIENKLNNAADRLNQLKDYLNDTEKKGKTVLKIVYIPLYAGKKSPENVPGIFYLCPQDLSEWLKACARKSQGAFHVVLPYIQLLNYINQSNRNYMKAQELYELLKQDPKLMDAALNIANTLYSPEWVKFLCDQLCDKVKTQLNDPNLNNWPNKKESELWLRLGNGKEEHKYWVSVAVGDKYYLYLYFYDEQAKQEEEKIERSGQYGEYYYIQLSDTYRIGDETDTEKLVSKVVELLRKSRR